jgi:hypothetical protein
MRKFCWAMRRWRTDETLEVVADPARRANHLRDVVSTGSCWGQTRVTMPAPNREFRERFQFARACPAASENIVVSFYQKL